MRLVGESVQRVRISYTQDTPGKCYICEEHDPGWNLILKSVFLREWKDQTPRQ